MTINFTSKQLETLRTSLVTAISYLENENDFLMRKDRDKHKEEIKMNRERIEEYELMWNKISFAICLHN